MKKTMQLVSLAAAASVFVGCSSNRGESSANNNPSSPAAGTSYNTSGGNTSDTATTASGAQNENTASSSGSSGFLGIGGKDVTIDQLPTAAQQTIRNTIGDQQIAKIRQETKDGQTAYKVELQKKGFFAMRPDLIVAADGSIIKESHMEKVNEAAGAQNPQSQQGQPNSQLNQSEAQPNSSTNSVSPQAQPQQ